MKLVASFEVGGEPVAKERPRLGKRGNTYTPTKTLTQEALIGWGFRQVARGHQLDAVTRYVLEVEFIFGHSKDLDNMVKTVMDGLNGVAYADDKQVSRIVASKYPATEETMDPQTLVRLYALEPGDERKRVRYVLRESIRQSTDATKGKP